jgi:patatin-like phospholipase/acyl hydrolase
MAKFFRILSIDGGGIRCIIPAQVLVALEKKLQDRRFTETLVARPTPADFCIIYPLQV